MRPPRHSLALAAALLVAAEPGSAQQQIVHGRISDAASGRPVAGASVALVSQAGTEVATATTDADGRYRLAVPSPGAYVLRVQRVGYRVHDTPAFTLRERETRQLPVRLEAEPFPLDPVEGQALRQLS